MERSINPKMRRDLLIGDFERKLLRDRKTNIAGETWIKNQA
jgi:hypothetical protein